MFWDRRCTLFVHRCLHVRSPTSEGCLRGYDALAERAPENIGRDSIGDLPVTSRLPVLIRLNFLERVFWLTATLHFSELYFVPLRYRQVARISSDSP